MKLTGITLPLTRAGRAVASLTGDPHATGRQAAALSWVRHELRSVHGFEPAPEAGADTTLLAGLAAPGSAVGAAADAIGMEIPAEPESYAIRAAGAQVVLAAATEEGLLRGVTTLAQLVSREGSGDLVVASADIVDWPDLLLRILIGWIRAEPSAREMIDVAFRWKYNRVFFGPWSWSGSSTLTRADRWLVSHARELGIELVFQLSRLSFARGFDAASGDDAAKVIGAYEAAADAGFRSFGILFDDQTMQSVDAELALTLAIHARLRVLLGTGFELTFVPEVYWVPGELAGWPPQPGRAEEFRAKHRAYLEAVGAGLPADIGVYIANNWNDFPPGCAARQEREFNALVRRKPIFFENQLTNDYRRAIVLPFPVHNRPPEFAGVMGGYGLNLPMPYAPYRPAIAACGALAWHCAGYDPPLAWGAALLADTGEQRAPVVLEALNELNALFVEWTAPHFPAASHYGSLRAKLKEGSLDVHLVRRWRERLAGLKERFTRALLLPGTGTDALCIHVEEMERLDTDMALLLDTLETREALIGAPPVARHAAAASWRARQDGRRQRLLSLQSRRSPPSADLRSMLARHDGSDGLEGHVPSEIPSGWWLTYFYIPMRDDIDALIALGSELLAGTVSQ